MGTDADRFFEGAEKLMEIWFTSDLPYDERRSLRCIPRGQLEILLEYAHCQICSATSDDNMDSYVLSESSMFISDDRFILKTCGSTSLLNALKPLLSLAVEYCGLNGVKNIFYSRKNFMRPDLQPEAHVSFEIEVAILDELFSNGAAYCMGKMNRDCWYLYTLDPPPQEDFSIEFPDQTLEVLMSDLDPEVMSIFTTSACSNGKEATKLSGIDTLVPRGTIIDDKLFEPHGYSMNGILPDGKYATIHITPEAEFSYVSYETNIGQKSYFDLLTRILYCFRPGKFLLTVCANKPSIDGQKGQKDIWHREIPGYKRVDAQFLVLPEHDVAYSHFVRK